MDELDEERSLKLKELLSEYFDKRRDLDMSKEFQQDQDDEDDSLNKFKVVCVCECVYVQRDKYSIDFFFSQGTLKL